MMQTFSQVLNKDQHEAQVKRLRALTAVGYLLVCPTLPDRSKLKDKTKCAPLNFDGFLASSVIELDSKVYLLKSLEFLENRGDAGNCILRPIHALSCSVHKEKRMRL
jgi:hypothetical protein